MNKMRIRLSLFFLGLMLMAPGVSKAQILIGPVINPANGHTYFLLEEDNWTNSEADAVLLGGHLVAINDQAENDWVHDQFSLFDGFDLDLWIGLNDEIVEGVFVWTNEDPFIYFNWGNGEPNSGIGQFEENYVFMLGPPVNGLSAASWNDAIDIANAGIHGVVEVVPEPGVATGLICGITGMCIRRRQVRTCPSLAVPRFSSP